jgi:hypothetical protein
MEFSSLTKIQFSRKYFLQEMVSRSTLEASKLDLMTDISNLKLKFVGLERDKVETEHKLRMAQHEIAQVQKCMQLGFYQQPHSPGRQPQQQQQQIIPNLLPQQMHDPS